MPRRLTVFVVLLSLPLVLLGEENLRPAVPGPTRDGFLLPNGWTITPAGNHVPVTDLPLNVLPLADNRHALVATSGYNKHELSLIDLSARKVVSSATVLQSWYGLALSPDGERVWWSGGGGDRLHTFDLKGQVLTRTSPAETPPGPRKAGTVDQPSPPKYGFKSGLLVDARRQVLYSLDMHAGTISALRLKDGDQRRSAPCGGRPYDVVRSPDGSRLYVSDWAGRTVLVLDPEELRITGKISVGDHPNQMVVHPRDGRLFVACASSNKVAVIDLKQGTVVEMIATALFPNAPEGSTPNAVALAPDGETLYVANADNNCVAVIDVATPGRSAVRGFIPTGWYPTAVALTPDGKTLLVGVGKGSQSKPNPFLEKKSDKDAPAKEEKQEEFIRRPFAHLGTLLSGMVSLVPVPDDKQLALYTAQVYRNCPYADQQLQAAPYPVKTAIPTKVGEPSPIEHVIYIIKENRTYDQVFGDVKEGNGDASLCMFPEKVTPNHHKLAREFTLLDSLYCNGHVSADGHPWSTMAYATDYVAKNWHLGYSRRKDVKDDEKGNLSNAPSGYLWDACAHAGLTYRSYGEYGRRVSQKDGTFKMEGGVPGLVGHVCPDYGLPRTKEQKYLRDDERVDVFLREYHEFEKNGAMPRLTILSLPEDHTWATTPGAPTPIAAVASNDLALGRLVEAVSHGKHWKETAIFVIEDDAQNGPDHVDAQCTVGLVISPYVRRHHVDSTQYTTVSLLHTMELILGLKPLSQFDAAARPMFAAFTDKPDLKTYEHEEARIDLKTVNGKTAYGALRSQKMDFSAVDLEDDFEMNEILWRSIHGAKAALPAVVRRAIADRPADAP